MGLFSFFKKKSEKEKLHEKYKALLKESYDLSKIDRAKSDAKRYEAEELAKKIDKLP